MSGATVTLEVPCAANGRWQPLPADSPRVEGFDFCGQCFPDDWDTVEEKDVETFLYTTKNGTKLHRSIDTGDDADTSAFGDHDYPEENLAAKLAQPDASLDHEFEWDQEGGDA
ncbi:hypothetical protein AMS69_10270 [Haloarcula rubripromontorii]|uniref:Uncharacterized protein n=1 Tax=Haloarcula rubripromontorii TaxID=1705562 RepID=A0A0N0U962_9EURY|nr:hypothetical protein [Haloarcula rubripromontorii]KOX92834.1 hypothetical protein AMS69_10270 [Haloarcula rubripromontorii]